MIRIWVIAVFLLSSSCSAQTIKSKLVLGAEQMDTLLPKLKGKNVGLVVNNTALVGKTHLADTLLSRGIQVKKIFGPEHGFRGDVEAGEKVLTTYDKKTGLDVISLYGKNKKPSKEQLKNVDVLLYDIQDVGVRFYTYISSMHYLMLACAENNIPIIVFDINTPGNLLRIMQGEKLGTLVKD